MVTPDLLALVDEIEARARKATPDGVFAYYDAVDERWSITGDGVAVTADDAELAEYCTSERILTLTAALREAMGENEKLREALKPFSQAGAWRYSQTDGYVLWTPTCDPGYEITVGDLRAARAALKEAKNV